MSEIQQVTVAEGIVEIIKQEEIDYVFSVPGESYLPLLDALYDTENITLISARHEGGAAFMAEGYGKASGKPGIVMATRGVGAANLSIGVHTAYQDSTPMVVFLGQVRSDFRGREGFQEVDFEQFFAPITKWTVEITDPSRTPELIKKAFYTARTGRPGPVVVSLPEDVLSVQIKIQFSSYVSRPKPAPAKKEVDHIETILEKAERPLMIAGGGIKAANAEGELITLSEKYLIPVMTSFRRHDVFPNDHPLYVGHLGMGTDKEVVKMAKEADVLIAIGTKLSEVTTQDYSLINQEHQLIHIDISAEVLHKTYTPTCSIVADAKEAILAMQQMQVEPHWEKWARQSRDVFEAASKLPKNMLINEHVIATLQSSLSEDAIVTNDAGNFATWLHAYYIFREKKTYIGPTSGSMGYALPAALGAKVVHPDKQVIALAGDGGFMMTVQELETAVRYDIPVICIVFNNKMYGTIRMHQEMHYPERVIGTDLGNISFTKLAESLGATSYIADTKEDFDAALQSALEKDGVVVIEVPTDKENISVNKTITQIRGK
ncbi:MAG TPA: thiamine pyrophosphate-dependent enzyme [Bacillota bacterium]|nr:thiamine pyrophosphate-dependent enzyme [Bacillota bacterium]